ncbi:CAAX protease [Gloeocapsopsis sp. IPPAS B-1203]|uniref:CAAX protease n=1 Tax=Gloeocapsopsis sp. IPPAS B-1203 TaxID=2049454 RepID=UPI0025A05384|nr:CAAX protease [Gloeocapsopsis sp. IPPAS B-1203]
MMSDLAVNYWRELISGALTFSFDAFQQVITLPYGLWLALLVVLLSGLSLAVGQSIILFINRVKPRRFAFSLLLNAVLFTFGFIFLALSTWLICRLPWSTRVSFLTLVKVLGLGYTPLLFSFLGALPYFGYPINNILAVWNLLAMVVGFAVVAQVDTGSALIYIALGWVVKQVLTGTIGQPIARLGYSLADRVAGVDLANTRQELRERVLTGVRPATPIMTASQTPLPERQLIQIPRRSAPEAARTVAQSLITQPIASTTLNITQRIETSDPLVQLKHQTRGISQPLKLAMSLLVMAIAFAIVLVLLRPIRNGLFGWYKELSGLLRLVFDLVWIGVVAIVFAGILAPLESLGWWAGWYGDDLDTATANTESAAAQPANRTINRYVVYLDGIAQSGDKYTPDIEDFLAALQPALPKDVELIQGLMMYSVLNKPLDQDRPLAFLWKMADKVRWTNPAALLGLLVNLRNTIIVAVSSDKRYGPIYNQGIAQVIFDGLVERGYQPGSGVPITLIGYSGGGEMSVAAAPYLKRSTGASIDVISLGGVMSANNNFLKLEQLYHIVGDKDTVERMGPIMFPGRWKIFVLSYWNRGKRKGKITILSAGPVGHQVPGGYMDPQATLLDGRTYLQQTIEIILQILRGEALRADQSISRQTSHYALYQAAAFNRPDYYPIAQTVDLKWYRPIGDWMGRLILPKLEVRSLVQGVLFEVHHAPKEYRHLIGQTVKLRWVDHPDVQKLVQAVTKDVHFSADAEFSSRYGGSIHPDRLNHWQQVDPLESLAGAHPVDDLIVKLDRAVEVTEDALYINSTPIQITGRFYALVRFVQAVGGTEQFQVIHFDRVARQFNGKVELMHLPQVILAKAYGSYPSTTRDLEKSPFNETGWYVYGAKDAQDIFVVQSLAPRVLFRLQPEAVVFGRKAAYTYIRKRAWANIVEQKGKISSVLCPSRLNGTDAAIKVAIDGWQVGDRALVVHTYGGIGGKKKEPAAATPIFFGHFAYGLAEVVRDPLADELRFDICYHQVYTQNTDGLIAGTLHWSRYMGDRQFGWVGTRPTCDILIKLDAFTNTYTINNVTVSPLDLMMRQLQVMTARYRIGDGTGGTYVGPANNCSQDSNQALFASIRTTARILRENPQVLQMLLQEVDQEQRFKKLQLLGKDLEGKLQSLGGSRTDWEKNEYNLGSTLEDNPLRNLWTGLGSWQTMLPRKASDTIVQTFLKYGASVWILRTNQIGGYDPDTEPIAPITL